VFRFQPESDSPLEQRLRVQTLVGVKAALSAAVLEELLTAPEAAIAQLADPKRLPNHL